MQSISIAFYTETKIKTPFGGCRRSTRQQPVALRFRIWYQEMKCWSIATAIPDSSDPRINFAMRQNRPDPRRRRVMKEEVRTTSARPALKWFAIAGTIRPKLFLKIKKVTETITQNDSWWRIGCGKYPRKNTQIHPEERRSWRRKPRQSRPTILHRVSHGSVVVQKSPHMLVASFWQWGLPPQMSPFAQIADQTSLWAKDKIWQLVIIDRLINKKNHQRWR